jgi:hypothetical protein
MDKKQNWCMRSAEDGKKVIRFHSCPQKKDMIRPDSYRDHSCPQKEMKMENEINMEEQILEVDKLYNDGDYTECKRVLLDMLDQEPGFGRAHDMIGCLYLFVLDDLNKAVKHARLAVKFAPNYPTAFINCTRMLNYLNRHEELMEVTTKALQVEGINKCIIFIERGKSFEKNEKFGKALDCYYEAEKFAITPREVEEVKDGIKRLKSKSLRPLKKMFWFNILRSA